MKCYVRRWKKIQNALVFILSNGRVQAYFRDKSELLFDKQSAEFIGPGDVCARTVAIEGTEDPEFLKRYNLVMASITKKRSIVEEPPNTTPKISLI